MTHQWRDNADVLLVIALIFSTPLFFFFDNTTSIVWTIFVPLLPLLIVLIGFSNWRNTCPLAAVSKISQKISIFEKRKVPEWLSTNFYLFQYSFLFIALILRLTVLNSNNILLGIFFISIFLLAFLTNLIYTGKSWCNFFCPVGVVEKIYCISNTDRYETNSACSTCTACKHNCPDIDMESNYWKEKQNKQKTFVFYSFSGLILGFYVYFYLQTGSFSYYFSGEWTQSSPSLFDAGFYFAPFVPVFVAVPLTLFIFTLLSYFIFKAFEIYLKHNKKYISLDIDIIEHRVKVISSFFAFNFFYIFAGAPAYTHYPFVYSIFYFVVVVISTRMLYKEIYRQESYFIQERFALKIIKRWDSAKQIPSNLKEIYYTYISENTNKKKRLQLYKDAIGDLLKDGILDESSLSLLETIREQMGISHKDHFNVMRTIKLKHEELFDDTIEKSSEKRYQEESYRGMILDALNSHTELDVNYIKSLQKQFHITDETHQKIMYSIFNTDEKIHNNILNLLEQLNGILKIQNKIFDDGSREISFIFYTLTSEFRLLSKDLFALLNIIYKDHKKTLRTLSNMAKQKQVEDSFELNKETLNFMDDEISDKLIQLRAIFHVKEKDISKYKNRNIIYKLTQHKSIEIATTALVILLHRYPRLLKKINTDRFMLHPQEEINELAHKIIHKKEGLVLYEKMMYLNDVAIFQDIKFQELKLLAMAAKLQIYKPKSYIIEQGGVGDTLFVLIGGKASVEVDKKKINTLTDKDYFGEIAILGDTKRTASVFTLNEVTALTISKRDFEKFLDENPKTHNKLMKNIIKKLLDIQAKQH